MATTHLRGCEVPEVRQDLLRWADENVVRGQRGSGAVQVRGFTDPFLMQTTVRGTEQFFVNDQMTWLARTTGEELPVCAFDADDFSEPIGFLLWSEDPSTHTMPWANRWITSRRWAMGWSPHSQSAHTRSAGT
ncbi:hypothetical protein [Streptomyces sp. NPDC054797]